MNKVSERRLKENEVTFREINKKAKETIEEAEGKKVKRKLPFFCECSNSECRKLLSLTPQEYKEAHSSDKTFTVLPGHVVPEIEKIIEVKDGYQVVEKYGKIPSPEKVRMELNTAEA